MNWRRRFRLGVKPTGNLCKRILSSRRIFANQIPGSDYFATSGWRGDASGVAPSQSKLLSAIFRLRPRNRRAFRFDAERAVGFLARAHCSTRVAAGAPSRPRTRSPPTPPAKIPHPLARRVIAGRAADAAAGRGGGPPHVEGGGRRT